MLAEAKAITFSLLKYFHEQENYRAVLFEKKIYPGSFPGDAGHSWADFSCRVQ
jgi:hypothetical protein